jgi:hypothetical protein
MTVDPTMKRIVLVVHGAQFASNADVKVHQALEADLRARLPAASTLDFACEKYAYEDLNDQVKNAYYGVAGKLFTALGKMQPLTALVTDVAVDVALDVVINLADGTTAHEIRKGLKDAILFYYEAGNPCYVLAHSLGSIYAFDVINELMSEAPYFHRSSRATWPVQALLTIGSPIGLGMFRNKRPAVARLGSGAQYFRWSNMWDRGDPVVSGRVFGGLEQQAEIAEKYRTGDPDLGWDIHDHVVDTGKVWIASHTAYWTYPAVLDHLLGLASS